MASFATPQEQGAVHKTLEESASELYALLEQYFDELGMPHEERDRRYAAAAEDVIAENARLSKSAR